MSTPKIIVHFRSADGLDRYEDFYRCHPNVVLRRACILRLRVGIERDVLEPRPVPVREYEYSGIEILTRKKLVILYREIL